MHLISVVLLATVVAFIGCLNPSSQIPQSQELQSENKLQVTVKSRKHCGEIVSLCDLPDARRSQITGDKIQAISVVASVQDEISQTPFENEALKDSPGVQESSFVSEMATTNDTDTRYNGTSGGDSQTPIIKSNLSEETKEARFTLDNSTSIVDDKIDHSSSMQVKIGAFLTISSSRLRDQSRQDKVGEPEGRAPSLRFPTVPEGEAYRIKDLGLSEGTFLFSYLGQLLSWLQPFDFPFDAIRAAMGNRPTVINVISQSLKVEAGFIICLSVGLLLSLTAPGLVVVHACCRLLRRPSTSSTTPPPPPPPPPHWTDDNVSSRGDEKPECARSTLVVLMLFILLLIVAGIVVIFITNEQLSVAVHTTPDVVHSALADASTFLRNSHLQLHFVITQSLDHAVEACSADLDDVDNLLGRPIQRELASETGVDVALDALVDLSKAARALSERVETLQDYTKEAQELMLVARERLAELRQQIDLFRRQCSSRDRPLCETVDSSGLDVVLRLESIMKDENLRQIRNLGGDNLTSVTSQARGEFQFIPMHVEKESRNTRIAIRRQLSLQRTALDDAIWSLDVITRDLSAKVEDARDRALQLVRSVANIEQWRWLTALCAGASVAVIWLLLLIGVSLGCCDGGRRANGVLTASLVLICLFTTSLWFMTISALLVGGHAEVFVCRPLNEDPEFDTLTRLVDDKPGIFYKRGGFFSNLLYNNATLDVKVRDVLRDCRSNMASYQSFLLSRVFDVESSADHRRWGTLHADLANMQVNLTGLVLLKPELQDQLQELLQASAVNLTHFRAQLAGQVTGKDLSSFADQLDSVANQITDLATASRVETLASKTRRLFEGQVKTLEQRKDSMVYQLASIEVLLAPLQRQVNQSLSHFKTIQYYINNQGSEIAQRKTRDYTSRLIGYLDQYRRHVIDAANHRVAPCRPLWDIFQAMRLLVCRHVMDPLNGFWFALLWCLLLLLFATPLSFRLMDHYRVATLSGRLLCSESAESQTETLVITGDGGAWLTPGTQEPDGW